MPMGFLAKYGLFAVYAGTFAEGETVLFTAGILAANGVLPLAGVFLVGWLGSMTGHIFWFAVGNWFGARALRKLRISDEKFARIDALVQRNPIVSIVLLQYLYGLRIAGAAILGVTRLNFFRFLLIEVVNCAVWAMLVSGTGYVIGEAAMLWFHGWTRWVLIAMTAAVLAYVVRTLLRDVERRVDAGEPPLG